MAFINCKKESCIMGVKSFDLIIENGRIIDGAGNPWFRADIGVIGDKIANIGELHGACAANNIDVEGYIVSPGFIDIHGHSDYSVLIDPRVESKIRQGVTTEVLGHCGNSPAPMSHEVKMYRENFMRAQLPEDFKFDWNTMAEYLDLIEKQGTAFNVVALVGQGTVRQNVMGFENRQPTKGELYEMKELVDGAMIDGAWGMSSGLVTTPSCYADTDELVELAKIVAKHNGVYYCHIRGEGETLTESLREAIEVGSRSSVSLEIVHFKASGKENWGKTEEGLRIIQKARNQGFDVTIDQYPYIASSIGLSALIPPWVHEGGVEKLLERLRDPEVRQKIAAGPSRLTDDLDMVVISYAKQHPEYEGKSITEIAKDKGQDPIYTIFDILLEEKAQVGMVYFGMSEDDVKRVMKSPYMMVCSDGRGVSPTGFLGKGKPHPRYYGAFPRVLGRYVNENVISLQEAVRKMTSMPAQRIGLRDRGLLREGFKADITVFDPKNVRDEATFITPHRFASGIPYVIVNGIIVIRDSKNTGQLPGEVIRKPSRIIN
jgi:N-acyl-D-amino-acid deacylase